MRTKLTDAALTAALILTLLVIALSASAINTTVAQAYTLGAADSSSQAAPLAAQLGARTYRIVMDPSVPLDVYAPRVEAYRAAGMLPQIVVGGTGTTVRGKTTTEKWRIVNYAVHALQRWPDTYSVSVINEPDMAGVSVCQYAKTFRTAYKMLKAAGAKKVLFGEWSPGNPLRWSDRSARCTNGGGVVADGWAWHGYDANASWIGVKDTKQIRTFLRAMRPLMHTRKGSPLPMYCTEYGALTRALRNHVGVVAAALSDDAGAYAWANALRQVRRYGIRQIVAWGVMEAPSGSKWDSSLVDSAGRPRQAFNVIASQR